MKRTVMLFSMGIVFSGIFTGCISSTPVAQETPIATISANNLPTDTVTAFVTLDPTPLPTISSPSETPEITSHSPTVPTATAAPTLTQTPTPTIEMMALVTTIEKPSDVYSLPHYDYEADFLSGKILTSIREMLRIGQIPPLPEGAAIHGDMRFYEELESEITLAGLHPFGPEILNYAENPELRPGRGLAAFFVNIEGADILVLALEWQGEDVENSGIIFLGTQNWQDPKLMEWLIKLYNRDQKIELALVGKIMNPAFKQWIQDFTKEKIIVDLYKQDQENLHDRYLQDWAETGVLPEEASMLLYAYFLSGW